MVTFSRVPRRATIHHNVNPLLCLCTGGKSEGHIKRVFDLLPIFAYEGNEYRLIATKENRIGYFD